MCSQISPACSSTPSHRADAPAATPYRATRSALTAVTSSRGMFVPRPRPLAHGTAFAGFEFEEPVRTIVHKGKYGGDRSALRAIASLTAERLDASRASPPAPGSIVAVPLGPRRRRQRGYNQSDILARVLAEIRNVPVLDGLRRTRETKPQSVCDEPGRRRNVAGAFAWVGSPLHGSLLAGRRRAHNRGHGGGCRGIIARCRSVPGRRHRRGGGAVTGIPCQNEEEHVHIQEAAQ